MVCEEVVCPTCQECTEIIETSTDLEPDIEQKCRDRLGTTLIETVIDNSPKYNMLVTTGLLATGIISYLMFLNTPGLLISLISMLLGKKEENPWGVVMDASTRKPISLALCKLFLAGTTNLVEQTITDNDGVYGFSISPGSYRLEVTKPGYEKEVLKFSFGEGEYGYVNDVMLSKTDLKATGQQDKPLIGTVFRSLLNIYRKLFPFLFGVGLVIAVFSEIYAPSTTNTIILILYIVVGSIYLYSIILEKQSKLSSIVDPSTSLRIPNALIKIFSLENGKLIDTKITNSMGFFDYWKEPGEYALHTSARGYSFPSEVQTDLEKIVVNSTPMLKVRLKKGKNKLKILVDPIES